MKIAQICPYDIDRPGGVQRHILDTAQALTERGHQLTIIAPGTATPPLPPPAGVTIRRLGRAFSVGFSGTRYEISLALGGQRRLLRQLMREEGFDVAHFHTVWTPFLAPQALSFFAGPAVVTFHDTTSDDVGGRLLRRVFRCLSRVLLPRFSAVLTPSEGPQGSLVPEPGQQVRVFPPCTDLRSFRDSTPQPGFADGRINILFLGRLEPRKGAMLLLQAFRKLRETASGLRLIIAGGGVQEAVLKAYAQENGLSEVVFAGAPGDAAPWFAAADIFCAPSPYGESFGIVIAEAMAAGKPVVAAANQGYRTLLTGEAAEFLVPPGDVEALAQALAILAADAGLRRRLGDWGRRTSLDYDCRTLAPQLEAIYQEAILAHRFKARSAT